MIYMNRNGAKWLLIFNHDLEKSNYRFFPSRDAALYSNDENMFSRLSQINELSIINNKYEFILEYPPLPDYIQWTQDLNPITTFESNTSNSSLNINIKHIQGYSKFRGLMRSTVEMSLLDGDGNDLGLYFYSVGTVSYGEGNSLPGPYKENGGSLSSKQCKLWLRISHFIATCQKNFLPINLLLINIINKS